jgi:hypothetical protein
LLPVLRGAYIYWKKVGRKSMASATSRRKHCKLLLSFDDHSGTAKKLATPFQAPVSRPFSASYHEVLAECIASRLLRNVAAAEALDTKMAHLRKLVEGGARARTVPPVSAERLFSVDRRLGRSASYYASDAEALAADLPSVAAKHNAALAREEIQRRRGELAREKLRGLLGSPSHTHEELSRAVLARIAGRFGLTSTDLNGKSHASSACTDSPHLVRGYPVAKYSLRVVLEARLPDDEVDPEVLEVLDEQQAQWEANGDGKRGGRSKAQLVEAGLLRPEERLTKFPGTGGGARKRGKTTAVWRRLDGGAEEVVLYEE